MFHVTGRRIMLSAELGKKCRMVHELLSTMGT
jgi:hypothetical protein